MVLQGVWLRTLTASRREDRSRMLIVPWRRHIGYQPQGNPVRKATYKANVCLRWLLRRAE